MLSRNDYISSPRGTGMKKSIPLTPNLRVLKIKTKEYSGKIMHNFMLEEVHDFGPVNVAKFARYVK